eukprot:scpid94057/ scgid33614/ 
MAMFHYISFMTMPLVAVQVIGALDYVVCHLLACLWQDDSDSGGYPLITGTGSLACLQGVSWMVRLASLVFGGVLVNAARAETTGRKAATFYVGMHLLIAVLDIAIAFLPTYCSTMDPPLFSSPCEVAWQCACYTYIICGLNVLCLACITHGLFTTPLPNADDSETIRDNHLFLARLEASNLLAGFQFAVFPLRYRLLGLLILRATCYGILTLWHVVLVLYLAFVKPRIEISISGFLTKEGEEDEDGSGDEGGEKKKKDL